MSDSDRPCPDRAARGPRRWWRRQAWIAPVLPLLIYSLLGSLEPSREQNGGRAIGLAIPYQAYPLVYTLKIGLTLVAVAAVLPGYPRPLRRPSMTALAVGAVGVVVWVGLWRLAPGRWLLEFAGFGGPAEKLASLAARPAFNPFQELGGQWYQAWAFLAVRFTGLVAVVPLIEEFFLRGFLMPLVVADDWRSVPFGRVNRAAVAVSLIVPALAHPAEMLSAVAWFGMGTWLMVRTRNFWDCVAAHAVTNLLLGVYIVAAGQWTLW
ncbi:MAG: CAAX prenyl protease-related protein [Thermoguttaceae bacterium]